MKLIPTWVSWVGLGEHVAAGAGIAVLLRSAETPALACVQAVLVVGLVHEQAQRTIDGRYWSDFRLDQPGGPYNGILDVLAFLPAPIAFVWLWQPLLDLVQQVLARLG